MFSRCKLQIVFIDIRDNSGDLSFFLEDSSVAWDLNWYLWDFSSFSAFPAEGRGIKIESKHELIRCFFGGPRFSMSWTLCDFAQVFHDSTFPTCLCSNLCPLTLGNLKNWAGILNITWRTFHKWHKWFYSLKMDKLHTLGPKMLHLVNQTRLPFWSTVRTSPSKQELATAMRLVRSSDDKN